MDMFIHSLYTILSHLRHVFMFVRIIPTSLNCFIIIFVIIIFTVSAELLSLASSVVLRVSTAKHQACACLGMSTLASDVFHQHPYCVGQTIKPSNAVFTSRFRLTLLVGVTFNKNHSTKQPAEASAKHSGSIQMISRYLAASVPERARSAKQHM